MAKHKLRVGYVGTSIGSYFATEYGQRERAINGLRKLAEEWDFELVAIADEVMTEEAAQQAARQLQDAHIDFLMLQTAACSAGEQLLPLAKCAPRLGLWATPEPEQSGDIKLHSFVSMTHFASILKRYLGHEHIPFKWFYGHVETDQFKDRFGITVRALTAVKNLESARIGWIGGLAPGFINMMFDERKLHENLGVSVLSHEMFELVERAKAYDAQPVIETVRAIRAAASAITVSEDAAFDRVTRLYLAMRDMIRDYDYDALAVQCWSTIQNLYRVAPCMAYSWLGSEDGIAVSCEGDVLGAISMYLLNVLTGNRGSSTLLDMAALDPETGTALLWHCGVTPRHFADKNGIKWVDHTTLGRKQDGVHFGVAGDLVFAPQQTTITYVSEDGASLLALGASVIERQNKGYDGTRGWFASFELNQEPISLMDLVNTLTVRGHEHHYAVGQGNVTRELIEFAAWKKVRLIEKVPYADYVQIEGVNI
jgi:L-fucose isomerase-like protein